jgi:glycosyltransferase involved in cell wall biosynthesis
MIAIPHGDAVGVLGQYHKFWRGVRPIKEGMSLAPKFNRSTKRDRWMKPLGRVDLASIIIPTFNRGELLEETLASVAAQTYRPIEVIIVDDGSTDQTAALVRRWEASLPGDPEFILRYIFQANGGVSSARNHGLVESTGQFIQFLDSDDILHPRKLEMHIGCLLRHPQSGYAFSEMERMEHPHPWGKIDLEAAWETDAAEFFCSPKVLTMVGVYRRQTCRCAGPWSEDLHLGEDEEYNFRALLSTEKLVYLPGALCAFRDHAGPRLTDSQKHQRGWYIAMQAYARMAEVAAADGRMNDQRFVEPLVSHLTDILIIGLESGDQALAEKAIAACWKLPLKNRRKVRLMIYRMFNRMPRRMFPKVWPLWLKLRNTMVRLMQQEPEIAQR